MLCDICKTNEATVHLTQIINGKVRKADLCEACAKGKKVSETPDFSLADLMMGLGAAEGIQEVASENKCPKCGLTLVDFKKTGRLGCGTCWVIFERGLATLLRDMHRVPTHVGKVPARYVQTRELSARRRELEAHLKEAIENERYEEAAAIRDEIRRINAQLAAASGK